MKNFAIASIFKALLAVVHFLKYNVVLFEKRSLDRLFSVFTILASFGRSVWAIHSFMQSNFLNGVVVVTHFFRGSMKQIAFDSSYLFNIKSILFILALCLPPSIPRSSASVYVTKRIAITLSLKCAVSFSCVVPLSFNATHCHLLSLGVICCHLLSLDVPLVNNHSVLWKFIFT